jgi:hypothetical protein
MDSPMVAIGNGIVATIVLVGDRSSKVNIYGMEQGAWTQIGLLSFTDTIDSVTLVNNNTLFLGFIGYYQGQLPYGLVYTSKCNTVL